MRYSEVCIESFAAHLPDRILTSEEIECQLSQVYEKLEIPRGQLEKLTGVRERKVWPVGTLPSDVATAAAKKALEKEKIEPRNIDLIIHSGVCRDALEPSTANITHSKLGLEPHCLAFDLSNACVGFMNAMTVAANMISLGQAKRALIVTGENSGPIYEDTINILKSNPTLESYRKSLANLTLGSAAVAYVLTHKDLCTEKPYLVGGIGQADSRGHHLCRGYGDVNHLYMETNTQELMKTGLSLFQVSWVLFKEEMDWKNDTPDHFLTHQISLSHHKRCFELLELNEKKSHPYIQTHGNTGSAAAPLALVLAAQSGSFKKGDNLALLGIGSGVNTMLLGIQWF